MTDHIHINIIDIGPIGIREPMTVEVSRAACAAIVEASGLTARFDVLHKNTAQLIVSLANHIAALEKASDTARKAEIGESYNAGLRDGQACSDTGSAAQHRTAMAGPATAWAQAAEEALAKADATIADLHKRIEETKRGWDEARSIWCRACDTLTDRAERAEIALTRANAARAESLATADAEIGKLKEECKGLLAHTLAHTAAIIRAEKAEAGLKQIRSDWNAREVRRVDQLSAAYKEHDDATERDLAACWPTVIRERDAAVARAEKAEAGLEGRNDTATVVALKESVAALSSNLRLTGERADKAEAELATALALLEKANADLLITSLRESAQTLAKQVLDARAKIEELVAEIHHLKATRAARETERHRLVGDSEKERAALIAAVTRADTIEAELVKAYTAIATNQKESQANAIMLALKIGDMRERAEKAEEGLKDAVALIKVISLAPEKRVGGQWIPLPDVHEKVLAFLKQHGDAS